VPEEVTLQELIAQKDRRIRDLEADKQQMTQEIKLLKEKVDLLIRRIFGTRSEKLDEAQLELLLKEAESGKADASTEKVEASPIVENLKPAAKRASNNQRRERWPEELEVEQEVIEPQQVKENPEAFRFIGQEVTEMLDYRPAKFFRHQIIRRKFVRRQEPELAPIIASLPEESAATLYRCTGVNSASDRQQILRPSSTLQARTNLLEQASGLVAASKPSPLGTVSQ
jgi:hypothetical protein